MANSLTAYFLIRLFTERPAWEGDEMIWRGFQTKVFYGPWQYLSFWDVLRSEDDHCRHDRGQIGFHLHWELSYSYAWDTTGRFLLLILFFTKWDQRLTRSIPTGPKTPQNSSMSATHSHWYFDHSGRSSWTLLKSETLGWVWVPETQCWWSLRPWHLRARIAFGKVLVSQGTMRIGQVSHVGSGAHLEDGVDINASKSKRRISIINWNEDRRAREGWNDRTSMCQ